MKNSVKTTAGTHFSKNLVKRVLNVIQRLVCVACTMLVTGKPSCWSHIVCRICNDRSYKNDHKRI
ncbi:uncharacterized protein LOC143221897 isoform X5 [Lasioglossum baleicum]|uniref:uncharacterized protein LOC143221897 isoform X5 n=1 Tax=Lasioglossum baleicum TaxID=434251 RepID=UPI003FCCD71C